MGLFKVIGAFALAITPAAACWAVVPASQPSPESAFDTPLSTQQTVTVREFHFMGNTVISSAELADAAKPWTGKTLTSEQLEQARRAITQVYVNKGYINSGARLPDQAVVNGIVTFQIIEGKLSNIKMSGLRWLSGNYIRNRIVRGAGPPLNIGDLKNRLELLRQDLNLSVINAELKPGGEAGQSDLDVTMKEAPLFHFGIEFDNKHPPNYGAEELEAIGSMQDVTGHGDVLSGRWGITQGGWDRPSFGDLNNIFADYALPLNAFDTTLDLNYQRSRDLVIEAPFVPLNISNETESYNVGLRQPVYHTPSNEVTLFVTGVVEDNTTLLAGEPFSFTPGQVNGQSRVTAIRIGTDWTSSNQSRAISFRSTFSIGLDALDSTVNAGPGAPSSRFFDWLGQFQYIQRLGQTDNQLVFRSSAQLSANPLLPQEQFAVGGFDTVRGYRESEVVRDEGAIASLELRIPILHHSGVSILEVAPFSDVGYAWNHDSPQDPELLSSVGIGLLFHFDSHIDARIYYGYPFKRFQQSSYNIQDDGIHFDLIAWAF